ncbi:MAG: hypothetical protein Q4D51_14130, partial [Eubacteriales bacterium]|nr:hypothetical protein [Eubacteriales bacterium]
MNIVYLGVLVIVAIYVLFRKRRFDFYALAFFSTIVYYYPAIIGKIRRSANVFDIIDTRVYCCLIIQSLVLFMCMVLADKYKVVVFSGHKFGGNLVKKENCSDGDIVSNLSVLVLELVGLLLLVFTYSSYGGFQLNFNKMKLLSEANRITEYLKYIALFTFVYAFTKKGKYIRLIKVISVVLISYTFLLGHRSFAVIGILAIFMSYFTNKLPDKVRVSSIIRKYWKIFLALMFAVVFFLFVKNVFAAFMSGQYDLVKQRLSDPNYYIDSLLSSEANSILSNLQAVCTYGMKYSVIDYFLIGLGIIPFMGSRLISSMGLISFEKQLNLNFNNQLSEGIGL